MSHSLEVDHVNETYSKRPPIDEHPNRPGMPEVASGEDQSGKKSLIHPWPSRIGLRAEYETKVAGEQARHA